MVLCSHKLGGIMKKQQTLISKKSSSKKNNNVSKKTPVKVLIAGRLAFIRARLEKLRKMKATAVVNNGNTNSPTTLEVGREIFNENVNRQAFLMGSQVSGSTIDHKKIEDYIKSLESEGRKLENDMTHNEEEILLSGV